MKTLVLAVALALASFPAAASGPTCSDDVVIASTSSLANGCITRAWGGDGIASSITDERTGFETAAHADFALAVDGVMVTSDLLSIADVSVSGTGTDQASITWTALLPGVASITRTVTMFGGVAGTQARTTIESLAPLALSGYTLDAVDVGVAETSIQEFRAGADWREPNWNPPSVGPNHAGDWREAHTAPLGTPNAATGEWITATTGAGQTVSIVDERRDYASSVASYDGSIASAGVDFSRDVVYIGPFEEEVHAENPGPGPARHRLVQPGRPLELETSFTIIGVDADDEAWQWSKYLKGYRVGDVTKRVMFNSDGVDKRVRGPGAKDDMDYARFLRILPAVREMGADTFIFDDGWMARSGDWCADSIECPEPRTTYGPRFPDDHFAAVQTALKGDPNDPTDDIDLGLWMNPMAYHPSAKAYTTNPQWSCAPVGTATGTVSYVQPNDGSYEPGIGLWNPRAMGVHPDDPTRPIRMIDYLEERIRRAIDVYGAKIFKFDFLVWVDCGGAEPVTMYEYRDEFVTMLDRIQADHDDVTFQIDDTNDHRMFPFETVTHGTSWFLNGTPTINSTLHTVWSLAPYVPGYTLGLRSLGSGERNTRGVDAVMAAAITSHLTFSFPVDDDLTSAQREAVKRWSDFYHQNSASIAGFTYPLGVDPAAKTWTALQPWDRDAQSGWLFAYRQEDTSASSTVALRGIDAEEFRVTRVDPANGSEVDLGVMSGATLRAGLPVDAASIYGYALYRIEAI